MSDGHYRLKKRERERNRRKRERKNVRRGSGTFVSLSGRLYVSNPDHDEKVQ